jgi:hypothetical protein
MVENEMMVSKPQETMLNMFSSKESFNTGYTMAKVLAESTIVPATFKGNIGNAMIAIDMAQRMHTNPLMVMQNMYIVYGQPAWSAKFLVACINASGLFASPLRYEFVGKKDTDSWGCYAYAVDKQGEVLKGSVITIGTAKTCGWYDKKDSMWKKEPEQMLRYRAATRFQTAYCPEISCGLSTKEEVIDADYTEVTESNINNLAGVQPTEDDKPAEELNIAPIQKEESPTSTGKKVEEKQKEQPLGKQSIPELFK